MESGQREKRWKTGTVIHSRTDGTVIGTVIEKIFRLRENESGAGVKKQTYQDGCVVYFMWFDWAYTSIIIKREQLQIYLYRVLIVITLLML